MKLKFSSLLLLIFITTFSQTKTKESFSLGIGVSNFSMHGDLRTFETGLSNPNSNLINPGAYLYIDKMFTPSFGIEAKLDYFTMSGSGQELAGTETTYGIPLNTTRFEGASFGGELNTIINLNNLGLKHRTNPRNWNFSTLIGLGLHRYNSKLYDIDSDELLVDFGNSPSENGTTTSMYFTTGLSLKYRVNSKIDIELRQNFNLNDDDHLDAAVSDKQALDWFFKTNLGIVFKLNNKTNENYIWQDNVSNETITITERQKIINDLLKDTDNDGVIDRFDKDNTTLPNTKVYANGKAIDSDQDGVPDFKDMCPFVFGLAFNGCIKADTDDDSDNDGIIDKDDECPTIYAKTPNGCPKDSDGDGVYDKDDACPNEFAKTTNGCPEKLDSDGDGILDNVDKCPNIYAKQADGCPKKIVSDRDKDGVLDKNDKCPLTFAKTEDGCPKHIKKETPTTKQAPPTPIKTVKPKPIIKTIINLNKTNVSHNNKEMNESVNVNSIDNSPIFPGCNKEDELFKKNCMITEISKFVNLNYKSTNSSYSKIRVLFIIDENGKTKVIKMIGSASNEAKKELKRVFNKLPIMTPGLLNGKIVSVKYSLRYTIN